MAACFHRLFVTDNRHILFMSEFPHLESGRGTVLSSQSPPPRPNKETNSRARAGQESRRAVPRAGSFQVCVCSAGPAEAPLGLLCRKVPQGCPRGNGPRRCSSGPRVSKSIPRLDRGACGCSHRSFTEGRGQPVLSPKGRRLPRGVLPTEKKGKDSTGLSVILSKGMQE